MLIEEVEVKKKNPQQDRNTVKNESSPLLCVF